MMVDLRNVKDHHSCGCRTAFDVVAWTSRALLTCEAHLMVRLADAEDRGTP